MKLTPWLIIYLIAISVSLCLPNKTINSRSPVGGWEGGRDPSNISPLLLPPDNPTISCSEFKTKSSDLFYFATILQIQQPPPPPSLLSLRPFGELRFAIPSRALELRAKPNVKPKNNLNDLLIRQFKPPSAVETRMANVCRETKEIKGERI